MPHPIYNNVASVMYTTAVEFNVHHLQCTIAIASCIREPHPIFNLASHYTHVCTRPPGIEGSLTPQSPDFEKFQKARRSPWPGLKSMVKSSPWGRGQELRRSQTLFFTFPSWNHRSDFGLTEGFPACPWCHMDPNLAGQRIPCVPSRRCHRCPTHGGRLSLDVIKGHTHIHTGFEV